MANKTITTQILLRNDTLAAWQASSRVLGKGEPAVVFDPNCEAEGYSVKVKFGDGVHTFSELPYSGIDLSDIPLADTTKDGLLSKKDFDKLSKLAAIAYKEQISETDLDTALREKVNAASEGNHAHLNKDVLDGITSEKIAAWDAAEANKIDSIKVNGVAVEVTDKAVNIEIPDYDDAALAGRIEAVETLVGDKTVAAQIANSINALDLPNTYDAKGAADTALADAKKYADAKDEAIAAAKKAGDDAQAAVDAVTEKLGTIPEDKSISEMITEAANAAAYDDTAVKADIAANSSAIETLNGTGAGSVKKSVDEAINDFATKISDDDVVNTFKELVDYCAAHGSEAAELAGDIAANSAAIAALEALVGSKSVAIQITEAIAAALKSESAEGGASVDKYALATDLAAAVTRIGTNESSLSAVQEKLDGITESATKVEASETNGNITINGVETTVYRLPDTAVLSTDTLILDGGNA